jgi:hypothetical protein
MATQNSSPLMRLAGISALVVGTLLFVVAGSGSASAQTDPPAAPSAVNVEFTPAPSQEGCVPFPVGVTQTPGNTGEAFTLRIRISRTLCTTVGATAAVYAMPSSSEAWPQTLVERVPFEMKESGTVLITFTKTCKPQQFDVIAGTSESVTPPTIAPTGPWHGPLLFPFDLDTTLQWPGCKNPTTIPPTTQITIVTTTVPSTTTPSTTTPSTTTSSSTTSSTTTLPLAPPEVQGETTIAPPPAQVLGVQQTSANLAFTGVGTKPALFGAVLIAFGLFFMLLGRKPISER